MRKRNDPNSSSKLKISNQRVFPSSVPILQRRKNVVNEKFQGSNPKCIEHRDSEPKDSVTNAESKESEYKEY